MRHPYFWDHEKRLSFLLNCSDYFESLRHQREFAIIRQLEQGARKVFDADWSGLVDLEFVNARGPRGAYDTRSVKDLLRTIRNNVCTLSLPPNLEN